MTEFKAPRCGYLFPLLAGLMLFASGYSLLTVQGTPAGHQMLESWGASALRRVT